MLQQRQFSDYIQPQGRERYLGGVGGSIRTTAARACQEEAGALGGVQAEKHMISASNVHYSLEEEILTRQTSTRKPGMICSERLFHAHRASQATQHQLHGMMTEQKQLQSFETGCSALPAHQYMRQFQCNLFQSERKITNANRKNTLSRTLLFIVIV